MCYLSWGGLRLLSLPFSIDIPHSCLSSFLEFPLFIQFHFLSFIQSYFSEAHCLIFQVFSWNLDRRLHDPTTLAYCMSEQPTSCGSPQDLLPSWTALESLQTIAIAASEYLTEWWNESWGTDSLNGLSQEARALSSNERFVILYPATYDRWGFAHPWNALTVFFSLSPKYF